MALALTLTALSLFLTIIVAYYFYRKSRKEKEPLCLYENTTLAPKIPIRYGDKSIERITRTHLAFWNNGREPIQKSDIRGSLEIKLEPLAEVLEAYVVKLSREETGFRVTPVPEVGGKPINRVNVTFDFLDKGDGASIEILHTGEKNTKPTFEGVVVGVPQGIIVNDVRQIRLPTFSELYGRYNKTFVLISSVVSLGSSFGVALGIILWWKGWELSFSTNELLMWLSALSAGTATWFLVTLLFIFPKKTQEMRSQPPKILR